MSSTTYQKAPLTKQQVGMIRHVMTAVGKPMRRTYAFEWIQVLDDGIIVATDEYRLHSALVGTDVTEPLFTAAALVQQHSDGRCYVLARPTGLKLNKGATEVLWEIVGADSSPSDYKFPDWNPVVSSPFVGQMVSRKYLMDALANSSGDHVMLYLTKPHLHVIGVEKERKDITALTYGIVMPVTAGVAPIWSPLATQFTGVEFKTNYVDNCVTGEMLDDGVKELARKERAAEEAAAHAAK